MNKQNPPQELLNLVKVRQLHIEPGATAEIAHLLKSASDRLQDAMRAQNSLEGRFDLAYNAAYALALAALRWHGFRSDNRYLVFHVLPHTTGLPAHMARVLAKAHDMRNRMEYHGEFAGDEKLLRAVIEAAEAIRMAVVALPQMPEES